MDDKESKTLDDIMRKIPDDRKKENLKFDVMRKIRKLAQARDRQRRNITRIFSVLLFALFGWITFRIDTMFNAEGSLILEIVSWTIKGSLLLLCVLLLLVFSLSFPPRKNLK